MKDIEEYRHINERTLYRFVNRSRNFSSQGSRCVEMMIVNTTTGKLQTIKSWLQHFDHLLNRNINTQRTIDEPTEETADSLQKGNPIKCANYRGITLMNTTYEVFSTMIHAKLFPYAEKYL
jgi:hypothetical protein